LQKRVQEGVATLLVKVKTHRGDPLNEEADIRTEMGLPKEQKEVGWNNPTNRTMYRWKVGQKEIGSAKWCKGYVRGHGYQVIWVKLH
jgi:hypothetical protein